MYAYKASEIFWKRFYALSPENKELAREKYEIFKVDPFDSRLGTHKIQKLSARYKTTVYGVHVTSDLLITFLIKDGNTVFTISIGSHAEYE
jgi:mRNA-degrading endonuclease YafQ of YafQ-DinJ toxin-antitoxin module